ncbi:MAG: glycosyltransferase family 2 protein [Candidatus Sungbacteria bacterium]|nr:glycosyltransferase family 2 protein [Candidatus Sungbacteria bacterium]
MITSNLEPNNPNQRPFFSVIIPTLGKIEGWKLSIQSILEQTFNDFELIAIDSGPETESRPIVEKLNDPRIKYVNTDGQDPRLNWDVGFKNAKGEYIIWAEDDNYLLPSELTEFANAISKTDADFITAEHIHWRGLEHPLKRARNCLIIRKGLFSGEITPLDAKNVIRRIFDLPYKGKFVSIHFSATAVKKELAEKLMNKIKEINFGTTGSHALRIGLVALAKNAYHIDQPLAIVGQSGTSMSDVWPKPFSKIKRPEFKFILSPVRANTYTNYRLENHLLIKKYLPDELAEFPIDYHRFFRTYHKELAHLDLSWKETIAKWNELFYYVNISEDQNIKKLKREINISFLRGLIIKLMRVLKIYGLIKNVLERVRMPKGGIEISLFPYEVTNIQECSHKLPEIIKKEIPEISKFFPQKTIA